VANAFGRFLERARARLARHSPLKVAVVAAVAGLVAGVVGIAAASVSLSVTNTEAFCISCHEMKDTSYAEYKGTIHDTNRTGVRATCPDCHVPHELGPKLVAKTKATKDLYGNIMGTIDTKEKFEKLRHHMATNVWAVMHETDSRECRNCHKRDAMSKDLQSERAQERHARAVAEGKTCIDCHFGIAHTEPDGPGPLEMKAARRAP
jgi:cytochrome c-type protein NapC